MKIYRLTDSEFSEIPIYFHTFNSISYFLWLRSYLKDINAERFDDSFHVSVSHDQSVIVVSQISCLKRRDVREDFVSKNNPAFIGCICGIAFYDESKFTKIDFWEF